MARTVTLRAWDDDADRLTVDLDGDFVGKIVKHWFADEKFQHRVWVEETATDLRDTLARGENGDALATSLDLQIVYDA